MSSLNITLFQLVAAGFTPNAVWLALAIALASGGTWIATAILAWAWWRRPALRAHIGLTLVVAGLSALAAHALAAALDLPRPFMVGLSPAYISHGARGSLPSAHACVMSAIALMFLLRRPLRPAGAALALVAALTGWARVYVGVHFPADIAAGLLLATGMTGLYLLAEQLVRSLLRLRAARRRDALSTPS